MIEDCETRLDAICASMEDSIDEYNQTTKCLLEALTGIHERLERIEKWIENPERKTANH